MTRIEAPAACKEGITILYVAIAVLPAMLLLIWLYTRDPLHAEPKREVFRLYLLGAAIVLPAGLLERALLDTSVSVSTTTIPGVLITAFFIAGMVEEFLKAAIVERRAVQRRLIHRPIDCVIFCGATALGFATIENVLYVTSSGFSTAMLRAVTAIPAHLMFGVAMGVMLAKSIWRGRSRAWMYFAPAALHGIYDSFALSNSWLGDLLLVIYLVGLLEWSLRQLDWLGQQRLQSKLDGAF